MHIFLGITGASGAPYAARLLEALAGAGCEIGLCASRAGVGVPATELYGDARLSPDETIARLVEPVRESVTLHDERDWHAPYASGSAKVDAYVICPCSMGTLGTIASGAMSNLIQRAASVALKEGRKLILCPRETPLSLIHLENMLRVRQAGAVVLFLAPGFYAGAGSVDDLLDFSERMLERARRKSSAIEWVQGDALALPFEDDSFDAATVGFGVRNLEDLDRGLVEMARVLRPGGRAGVLEITRPQGLLEPFYNVWFGKIVPVLGKLLPGGSAYTYLPASVKRFPGPEDLSRFLHEAGFSDVRYRLFAGGIVALHTGVK